MSISCSNPNPIKTAINDIDLVLSNHKMIIWHYMHADILNAEKVLINDQMVIGF